jgi:DNA adenine methylase
VLNHILPLLPKGDRLVEPFCGSGVVFLNTDYKEYLVSDINPDLINLFKLVQREGREFIQYCKSFFINTKEKYYESRGLFNSTDDVRIKSALFIYLNRHGFNGLCRYNSTGGFNVPFGKYSQPYFPEKELLFFHEKSKKVTFMNEDFRALTKYLKCGDVAYCDPPYIPLTTTANFTSYSRGSFKPEDQVALAMWAENNSKNGIPVLLSNHDTPAGRKLYKNAFKIKAFKVQRYISCDSANRGKAKELLALYQGKS